MINIPFLHLYRRTSTERPMKYLHSILVLLLIVSSCQSQTQNSDPQSIVGGPCEGCEAIFEYGDRQLTSTDTLPDFLQHNPKLKLTGIVYEVDGKTPAEDVILYIYQTDRNGIYAKHGTETGWATRHGYIRGWIKTDRSGKYTFYTFRPGAYPNGVEPEHIHMTVKEPDKTAYYIDEFVFDDDPLLTQEERNGLQKRGGSGIATPRFIDGLLTVERNIILGQNIPNYSRRQ